MWSNEIRDPYIVLYVTPRDVSYRGIEDVPYKRPDDVQIASWGHTYMIL